MADLRTDIRRFLDDLESAQTGLRLVLAEKRDALASADPDGLQRIAALEAERVRDLQALLGRRRAMLDQAAARGIPCEAISDLVDALAGSGQQALRQQIERVRVAADEIRRETWIHWIITRSISSHYAELLELIANCGQAAPTYDERPAAHQAAGGAILDASV
jgi:nucleotidyltransferase/DNA polymerase involved in DNA repair